ncbi:unnamed protein product [Adineta ricciae]|uniref:tRNA-intron lyase n=1 Tax=Adineta ricciae TaxID=249248 RepID=A0A815U252_ADIRI|nr:unnamed protein product [Adineta ricciae]
MTAPIHCFLIDNQYGLIFNPESVRLLRQQHRIIGLLTGNLPQYPRQNQQLGIPLQLSLQQCHFLSTRNIISMYQIVFPITDKQEDHLAYLTELDNKFQDQKITNGHERITEILLNRDYILQSNRHSSFGDNSELDPVISSLLATNNAWQNSSRSMDDHERHVLLHIIKQRLQQFTIDQMLITQPLESIRSDHFLQSITADQLKQYLTSPLQQLQCDVFADLYSKNYWISDGMKFGGDYLVYLDNPSKCHSSFIVTCFLRNEVHTNSTAIPLTHLIARCRVAVNVKKISVLATRKSTNEIEYLTINWNGF